MREIDLFRDYENSRLLHLEEYRGEHPGCTYAWDELPEKEVEGVPIALSRDTEGKLHAVFVPDTHLLAIGATRSGKTTGYVIPTMHLFLARKNKPSLVISDPKQELFRESVAKFSAAGYRVILMNFTDYAHSDCWNPLTKYYRLYQKYLHVEDEVELVDTPAGPRNRYRGKIYEDQRQLDRDIGEAKNACRDEVESGITALTGAIIRTDNTKDPFWEDSARDMLSAILYGMLEDSEKGFITEDTFSFDTVLRISDSFSDSAEPYDNGYFSKRDILTSKAFQLANKCIVEQASNTRHGITSVFAAKMSRFRDTSVRRITCTNTFEMHELDDGKPTVIFLSFKDEESLHYEIISMFLSNLYTELISVAREKGTRLSRPFYFLLDEFGNLPRFRDFDKVISACGGRNIWFLLILQSYAQLCHIYGNEIADIIKDNLNTHLFFGTNNPQTKLAFSDECGKKTVLSPVSALGGSGERIERYEKDTVPLVPVSALNRVPEGDFIVTRMREDVLSSHMERSYLCPEFRGETTDPGSFERGICFADEKYLYRPKPGGEKAEKHTLLSF